MAKDARVHKHKTGTIDWANDVLLMYYVPGEVWDWWQLKASKVLDEVDEDHLECTLAELWNHPVYKAHIVLKLHRMARVANRESRRK